MAPKPTPRKLSAQSQRREQYLQDARAEYRRDRRAEERFRFLALMAERAPECVRDLVDKVLPLYRQTVTETPALAGQPISRWMYSRADTDDYATHSRARLELLRWAHRWSLTPTPVWLEHAAQVALSWWHSLGPRSLKGPHLVWPFGLHPPLHLTHRDRGNSDPEVVPDPYPDALDRELDWFIRRQVRKQTWSAIGKESGVDWNAIRKTVARTARRLGFTLRHGERGRPSRAE